MDQWGEKSRQSCFVEERVPQACTFVACQCFNEEDIKDVSLACTEEVQQLSSVSQGETAQRSTLYLINSFGLSAKQQTLAKGLY